MALKEKEKITVTGACFEVKEEVKVTPPARPKRMKNKLNGSFSQQPLSEGKSIINLDNEHSLNGNMSTADQLDSKVEPENFAAKINVTPHVSAMNHTGSRERENGMLSMNISAVETCADQQRPSGVVVENSIAETRHFVEVVNKAGFEVSPKESQEVVVNVFRDIKEEQRVGFESCISPDITSGSQDEDSFFSAEEAETTSEYISSSLSTLTENGNEKSTESENSEDLSSIKIQTNGEDQGDSRNLLALARSGPDLSGIQISDTNVFNSTEDFGNSCSDHQLSFVCNGGCNNNSRLTADPVELSSVSAADTDAKGAAGGALETDTESEEEFSSSTNTSSEGEYDVRFFEKRSGLFMEEDFMSDSGDGLNEILSAFPSGTHLVSVTTDSEDDNNRGDTQRDSLKSTVQSKVLLFNGDESNAGVKMLACFSPKSECPIVLDDITSDLEKTASKSVTDTAVDQDFEGGSSLAEITHHDSDHREKDSAVLFGSDDELDGPFKESSVPNSTLADPKNITGDVIKSGSCPLIQNNGSDAGTTHTGETILMSGDVRKAEILKIKSLKDALIGSECDLGKNVEFLQTDSVEPGTFVRILDSDEQKSDLKLPGVTVDESTTECAGDRISTIDGAGVDHVDNAASRSDIRKKQKPKKLTIGKRYSLDSETGLVLSPEDDTAAELMNFVSKGSFNEGTDEFVSKGDQASEVKVTIDGGQGEVTPSSTLPFSRNSFGRHRLGYSESFSPGDVRVHVVSTLRPLGARSFRRKEGKPKRRSKTLPNNVFDMFKISSAPPHQMGSITLITDNMPATFPGFPINRRAQVALELYTTERSYVRRLETVLQLFKKPCEENNLLDKKELVTMFMNIEEVYSVNKDLLFMLLERISHWHDQQCVGDIFLDQSFKIIDRMKIYTKYCNNYPAAEKLYKDKIKKREFEAFINSCYEHQVCQAGLNLPAYLISVVQRIPRYLLLLQDLLKRTPENHPDHGNLSKAYSKMEHLAVYINNQKQTADGMKAMEQLRLRVEGLKALEGRALIKEADVVVNGSKKTRQAWLLNDMLVFAAKGVSRSSEVERTLELVTLWCMDLEDNNPQSVIEDSLEIYTPEHSYIMYAATKNEKKVWLQKLRTAVAQALHGEEANESYEIESRNATFTYKDGRNYCGNFVSGKRHGQGTLSWPNQAKYQGNWEDDDRCGLGELMYNCGDNYKGEWLDDKQHGIGTLHYTSGDVYHGQWYKGEMHGKGAINFKNGDRFVGDFYHNEIHGDGELICVNGLRYTGGWKHSKKHGKGCMHFPNEDFYHGEFANDQCNGQGEMRYADGSCYKGLWMDNRRGGEGEFTSSDGTHYKGGWSKDLINGYGCMEYSNGDRYNGNWFKNTRYGQGVMKYSNGDVYEGVFEYDLCNKNGKMTYKDGSVYEGSWLNGLRHGEGKMIYANKSVFEGCWLYGMRHFEGVLTYANQASYRGQWDLDKQQGRGMYTDSSIGYHYEGEWKNGLKHGKGVENTAEGRYEGEWKDGMRHGKGTEISACGAIYEGQWKENKKHGPGIKKLESGMVETQNWIEGKQVDITSIDVIELPLIQRR